MTPLEIEQMVYNEIVAYEGEQDSPAAPAPQALLARLTARHPAIPMDVWRAAAIVAYRQRSQDHLEHADELWFHGLERQGDETQEG